MKNHVVGLGIVLIFLFLFLSFSSWQSGYVVQGEDFVRGDGGILNVFSRISPFLIGLLIMGSIVLLVIISVEGK